MRALIENSRGSSFSQKEARKKLLGLHADTLETLPLVQAVPTEIDIKDVLLPECENNFLVFANGHLSSQSSRVSFLNLLSQKEAAKDYGAFSRNRWRRLLRENNGPFPLINLALSQEGAFLYLPPNISVSEPLQVIFASFCSRDNEIITPFLQIFAAKNTSLKIIFSTVDYGERPRIHNQLIDIVIEDNAKITCENASCSNAARYFEMTRVTLKKKSSLEYTFITHGAERQKSVFDVALEEDSGNATIFGLALLKEKNEAHVDVSMNHYAPQGRSKQLIKTILDDYSRFSFNGKIHVSREACQTDAEQKNHNLLLSPNATATSKPILEIFTDDVKAAHGASFGRLDRESLFYLMSRGLNKKTAQNILTEAYSTEIRERICRKK